MCSLSRSNLRLSIYIEISLTLLPFQTIFWFVFLSNISGCEAAGRPYLVTLDLKAGCFPYRNVISNPVQQFTEIFYSEVVVFYSVFLGYGANTAPDTRNLLPLHITDFVSCSFLK